MSDYAHSEVKVTVLGCAGSSYDEELRLPCSSYLVETHETAILLDCGFGSFESYSLLVPDSHIDAIFVSHAHADHVADLEAFMDAADVWRDQPRLVASEQTTASIVREPDSLPPGTLALAREETHLELPFLEIEFSVTTHQTPTLAACVSLGGRRVAYCADTGPTWAIPPLFVGADLAILECTLETRDESSSRFHLDGQEVGSFARELSARQTLITHVPPHENGEARLALARGVAANRNFILATTGLRVTLE